MNEETKEKIKALKKLLKKESNIYMDRLPLAIGINKVITKLYPDYSKRVIRFTLSRHCNNKKYLLNMIESNSRYNFDGAENGTVTKKQENVAKDMLSGKYFKEQAKNKIKSTENSQEVKPEKDVIKPEKDVIKSTKNVNTKKNINTKQAIIKLKKRRIIKPDKI
jgi:sRNA-binding protein